MLALVLAASGVSRSSKSSKHKSPHVVTNRNDVRQIVLKGERHMSTNFMNSILEQSFGSDVCSSSNGQCADCDTDESYEPTNTTYCCWKHGYANSLCSGWYNSNPYPDHVFMERSVYPWLLAMHDQPYEYDGTTNADGAVDMTFSEFIRSPFMYTPDKYPGYEDYAENPIQLWNAKLGSYQEFMGNVSGNLTYVNITTDTLYNLDKLQHAMQPLLDDGYVLINDQTEISYPPMSNGTGTNKFEHDWDLGEFIEAKVYDAQDLWKGLLSQEDLDYINSEVSKPIMKKAGFEIVHKINATHVKAAGALTRDEHLRHLRYLDDPRGAGRHLLRPASDRRRESLSRRIGPVH